MELIYLNHQWQEQGQLLDFSLDIAYGRDENNFELITSKNELNLGDYFYIKDSTYGGVVDEVVSDSTENVIYRGRSLEGILASFSVAQLESSSVSTMQAGNIVITVSDSDVIFEGTPTGIMSLINNQLGNPFYIVDGELEEEPSIYGSVDRSTDIYQALRLIFEPNGIKPRLRINNRRLELYAEGAFNYAEGQYFDLSQYRMNITVNEKIPNHLIGIYNKEGKTIVKHIYTDEEGIIQPYYVLDSGHENPLHNEEYEREGISEKVVSGLDEIVEVIQAGSTVENWDIVTPLTATDGNTKFNGSIPADWNEKVYTDYYEREVTEEVEGQPQEKFVNFTEEPEYTARDFSSKSDTWWRNHFTDYYTEKLVPQEQGPPIPTKVRFTLDDATYEPKYRFAHAKGHLPAQWSKNFSNYYTKRVVDNVTYYDQVQAEPKYDYHKQTKKPTDWSNPDTRKNYYMNWTRYKWNVKGTYKGKVMQSFVVYDSLAFANVNQRETFAKYFSSTKRHQKKKVDNTTWELTRYQVFSGKATIAQVADWQRKKITDFHWQKGKYYAYVQVGTKAPKLYADLYVVYKNILTLPSKSTNVYELTDSIKPKYSQGDVWRKVTDDYSTLCRAMLDRYDAILNQASSIEAKFDSDDVEFDVGDIVGGVHPFTQQQVQSTIQKKIAKITPDTITSTYEV